MQPRRRPYPGTHEIHPANPQQAQLSRPLRAARFPLPAPSALPMAFNTHSSARGSGLVQHVFRSPARLPAPAEAHGGACAAPPSEKRYSLSWVRALRSDPVITRTLPLARRGSKAVRVIKDGKVIGSLPLAEGGGYTGSIAAH